MDPTSSAASKKRKAEQPTSSNSSHSQQPSAKKQHSQKATTQEQFECDLNLLLREGWKVISSPCIPRVTNKPLGSPNKSIFKEEQGIIFYFNCIFSDAIWNFLVNMINNNLKAREDIHHSKYRRPITIDDAKIFFAMILHLENNMSPTNHSIESAIVNIPIQEHQRHGIKRFQELMDSFTPTVAQLEEFVQIINSIFASVWVLSKCVTFDESIYAYASLNANAPIVQIKNKPHPLGLLAYQLCNLGAKSKKPFIFKTLPHLHFPKKTPFDFFKQCIDSITINDDLCIFADAAFGSFETMHYVIDSMKPIYVTFSMSVTSAHYIWNVLEKYAKPLHYQGVINGQLIASLHVDLQEPEDDESSIANAHKLDTTKIAQENISRYNIKHHKLLSNAYRESSPQFFSHVDSKMLDFELHAFIQAIANKLESRLQTHKRDTDESFLLELRHSLDIALSSKRVVERQKIFFEDKNSLLQQEAHNSTTTDSHVHPKHVLDSMYSKEALGKKTLEELKELASHFHVKREKKKDLMVDSLYHWLSDEGKNQAMLAEVTNQLQTDSSMHTKQIHDDYLEFFNMVDRANKEWYRSKYGYHVVSWEQKFLISLLGICTYNSWVLKCEDKEIDLIEYKTCISRELFTTFTPTKNHPKQYHMHKQSTKKQSKPQKK